MLPRRARGSRPHRRPAVRLRGRGSRLPQLAARYNALLRLARTRSLGVFECDSFTGKFLDRCGRFVKVRATHAFEHRPMLGELDIRVLHDLHAVAPRIPELQPSSGQGFDAGFLEPLSDLLLIVHHQAEVAVLVGRLSATFGEVNKLISHIDEGYLRTAPTQRELEEPAIEGKRFFYALDLQGHVIDTDEPCLVVQFLDVCHVSHLPIWYRTLNGAQTWPTAPPGRGPRRRLVKIENHGIYRLFFWAGR